MLKDFLCVLPTSKFSRKCRDHIRSNSHNSLKELKSFSKTSSFGLQVELKVLRLLAHNIQFHLNRDGNPAVFHQTKR